jgi:hypothetical protein
MIWCEAKEGADTHQKVVRLCPGHHRNHMCFLSLSEVRQSGIPRLSDKASLPFKP